MGSYNKRISDQSKIKFDPINRELIDSENSELDARVESLETTVGDATSGLVKDVNDLESGDTTINGNITALYKSGTKNYLPLSLNDMKTLNTDGTWNNNIYSIDNCTFEVLSDDDNNIIGIKGNGTSSVYFALRFYHRVNLPLRMPTGSYILSGGKNVNAFIIIGKTHEGSWYELARSEGGDSQVFNVDSDDYIGVSIDIDPNTELNNTIFYPMIRIASDSFSEFQPYAMTNLELTNKVADLESRVYALEHPTP